MTGKTTSMRWPPPLPPRSSGISAASVGSAVIITRWPLFNTSGSIFCAALPTSQWPSLVMPMGTASYLSGSRPRMTEAAEARETSCSPERPPKRIPMRSRFFSRSELTTKEYSQDFLAEAGEDEFHAEERGAIVLVENRIDLNDFEGNHGLRVRAHLHGEMGFAVGDTAAYGSANAGRICGIDKIHIEADGDASGIVHGVLEGFGHYVTQAALINVAHGEDVDAGFLDDFPFLGVEIASADDDDIGGFGFRLEAEEVDELGRAVE